MLTVDTRRDQSSIGQPVSQERSTQNLGDKYASNNFIHDKVREVIMARLRTKY